MAFWAKGAVARLADGLRSLTGVKERRRRRSATLSSSSTSADDLEAAIAAGDGTGNLPASEPQTAVVAAPATDASSTGPSPDTTPVVADSDKKEQAVSSLTTRFPSRRGKQRSITSSLLGTAGHGAAALLAGKDGDAAAPKPTPRLMGLPPELQLMIVRHLEFGDVERLRRTCKAYRAFISPKTVREVFGPRLKTVLLGHCYLCLKSDPLRTGLLWADWQDPRYPLASKCIDCAVQRGELSVGRKVALGNFASVWVCRWCGYPVVQDTGAWNQPEFHRACYKRYNNVLLGFFLLGFLQFFIVVIGSALIWRYFKERMALIPSIIGFILAMWCILLLVLRGSKTRTYHWTLFIELACLGLWIPPLLVVVQSIQAEPFDIPKSTTAVLVFIGLNIFFRFLNAIGNVFLLLEYKFWRQNKPHVPAAKKALNRVIASFIFWTYPQSLEQEFPGRYRC